MYDYSPESCLIKDIDGQLYNIIDLWKGIKQPVDPSTIQRSYAPRSCLVENIDGTTVNVIDTILSVANGSGAGTSCLQEVIQARNEYRTLDERLDKENMKVYETINSKDFLPFKGEYITVPHSKVGFTKDMKIEGMTYKNLCVKGNEKLTSFYIQRKELLFAENNKTYTVIATLSDVTIGEYQGNFNISIENEANTGQAIVQFKNGTFVTKITTSSLDNTKKVYVHFWTQGTDVGQRFTINNIIVLEGDYIQPNSYIPSYFEGIKSVGEKENKVSISSNGKNLVNLLNVTGSGNQSIVITNAKTNEITIESNEKKGWIYAKIFEVDTKPNTNYIIGCKFEKIIGGETSALKLYGNTTNEFLKEISRDEIQVVNSGKNTKLQIYLYTVKDAFVEGISQQQKIRFYDIILSQCSTLSYESYKEDKKEILIPYEFGFKGLPSGAKDTTILKEDGLYIRKKIKRKVLNGSEGENWSLSHVFTNTMSVSLNLTDAVARSGNEAICDKLTYVDGLWQDAPKYDVQAFDIGGKGTLNMRILKSNLETYDITGLKKYLSQNPIIIYYELATPVDYKITDLNSINLETFKDVTYISSENEIGPVISCQAPSNPQAVVADLMVANESLSNELDVKTKELQAKDEHLMNENDLLTAKDLDMDFRIFELEEQLTPEVAKLSLSHNSPYLMIERCIERGLYEKEDMLYKMGRYLHGKRLTQEEYDKLKLMMG